MSSHLIRSDLVPILTGYLLVMVILAIGLLVQRRRAAAGLPQGRAAAAGRGGRGWPGLLRHIAADVAGGYLLLMIVVVAYYYGVARVGSDFLASAVTGSALLLAISLPVFVLASWWNWHRTRPRDTAAGQPRAAGGKPGSRSK